jgi:hypothetical protein
MRQAIPQLAGWLVTLHLALSVAAAVCLFDHAASHQAGHHQADTRSHSTLCAWACQANPGAGPVTAVPLVQGTLLLFLVLLVSSPVPSRFLSSLPHLRGPPSLS